MKCVYVFYHLQFLSLQKMANWKTMCMHHAPLQNKLNCWRNLPNIKETKGQPSQGKSPSWPHLTKTRQVCPSVKCMLIIYSDMNIAVNHNLFQGDKLPANISMQELYSIYRKTCSKMTDVAQYSWFLHHDNVSTHSSLCAGTSDPYQHDCCHMLSVLPTPSTCVALEEETLVHASNSGTVAGLTVWSC